MKINYSLLTVLALVLFAFSSCKPKKAGIFQCSTVSAAYYEDIINYSANPTEGNCKKVKNSLKDLVKNCDITNSITKEEREDIENMDCSNI